jgi:hypothetical protein
MILRRTSVELCLKTQENAEKPKLSLCLFNVSFLPNKSEPPVVRWPVRYNGTEKYEKALKKLYYYQ